MVQRKIVCERIELEEKVPNILEIAGFKNNQMVIKEKLLVDLSKDYEIKIVPEGFVIIYSSLIEKNEEEKVKKDRYKKEKIIQEIHNILDNSEIDSRKKQKIRRIIHRIEDFFLESDLANFQEIKISYLKKIKGVGPKLIEEFQNFLKENFGFSLKEF